MGSGMMRRLQENHLQHVVHGIRDDGEISRKSRGQQVGFGLRDDEEISRKSSSTCVLWGQEGREEISRKFQESEN